ncbi:MAG: hypothetical protein L6Q57_08640 [Alphaproteobacteria bacterium]|nr:hypothetical protein [Alphaproteobacteria bacterium]
MTYVLAKDFQNSLKNKQVFLHPDPYRNFGNPRKYKKHTTEGETDEKLFKTEEAVAAIYGTENRSDIFSGILKGIFGKYANSQTAFKVLDESRFVDDSNQIRRLLHITVEGDPNFKEQRISENFFIVKQEAPASSSEPTLRPPYQ